MAYRCDTPYRTNAIPPTPPKPFKERYPKLWWVSRTLQQWTVGALILPVITGALYGVYWLLIPGIMRLGYWVERIVFHAKFGTGVDDSMGAWAIGVATIAAILIGIFIPRAIGQSWIN